MKLKHWLCAAMFWAALVQTGGTVDVSDDVPGGVAAPTATLTPIPAGTAIPTVGVPTPVPPTAIPSPVPVPATADTTAVPTDVPAATPTPARTGARESWIAYVSNPDGQWSVYLIKPDGTGQKKMTRTDLSLNRWNYFSPALSPDLTRLIFVMSRNVQNHLYRKNLEDGTGKMISRSKDFEADPSWSWDGERYAFVSLRNKNIPQVFIAPKKGWPAKQVTQGQWPCAHPCFSPDGRELCFVSKRDGVESLYILSLEGDGSAIRRLTDETSANFYPAWSPDGSSIAFVSTRDKKYAIYVTDAKTGSHTIKLSSGPANDKDPCFSPDGSQLVFVSDRDGGEELYVMDKDGKNQRRVTYNHARSWQPCWR